MSWTWFSYFSQRMVMFTCMVAALAHCHIALSLATAVRRIWRTLLSGPPNRGLIKAAARQGTSKLKEPRFHMRVTRRSSVYFWSGPPWMASSRNAILLCGAISRQAAKRWSRTAVGNTGRMSFHCTQLPHAAAPKKVYGD
jgi:hypothetical protein